MGLKYDVSEYFKEFAKIQSDEIIDDWNEALAMLVDAWKRNLKIFVAGNGGNFLNALHFSTDWNKGVFLATGKSLNTSVSGENQGLISAIQNDDGQDISIINYYKYVMKEADIFVLMSAGGSSQNILNAASFAKEKGIRTIGLTGGLFRQPEGTFSKCLHFNSSDMQIVEDIHAMFGHTVLKAIIKESENLF